MEILEKLERVVEDAENVTTPKRPVEERQEEIET